MRALDKTVQEPPGGRSPSKLSLCAQWVRVLLPGAKGPRSTILCCLEVTDSWLGDAQIRDREGSQSRVRDWRTPGCSTGLRTGATCRPGAHGGGRLPAGSSQRTQGPLTGEEPGAQWSVASGLEHHVQPPVSPQPPGCMPCSFHASISSTHKLAITFPLPQRRCWR